MTDQSDCIGKNAYAPNPALSSLSFLIGNWRTKGYHPLTGSSLLTGRTAFNWHAGGAFIIMRSQIDHPDFPDGVALIGSDNESGSLGMIYFDERGVSRQYEVKLGEGTVSWQRDNPNFSQICVIKVDPNGNQLISEGRMSQNGVNWSPDLSQQYDRIDPPKGA